MAKAPKRGGSGRRKPRTIPGAKPSEKKPAAAEPVKPPAAKPVKPPAAQPVKPPAAKPVKPAAAQPVKPPAAKPVKPPTAKPAKPAAAQPVKPPAAKPIKPPTAKPAAAQPIKPPPAKPAKPPAAKPIQPSAGKPAAAAPVKPPPAPPARGSAAPAAAARGRTARADEEVVGARGRKAPAARGMSIGAKAGLLTALVTLLATGLTVYLTSGGGSGNKEAELNSYGYLAATALGGGDNAWWKGSKKSGAKHDTSWVRKTFVDLFGDKGEVFWDGEEQKFRDAVKNREDFTEREWEEIKKDKQRFDEKREKIDRLAGGGGGGATDPKKRVQARLAAVFNRIPKEDRSGRFKVLAAWVREGIRAGREGKWLAGNVAQQAVRYDFTQYQSAGNGRGYVDGTVDSGGTFDVRIFTANVGGGGRIGEQLTGYVAVWERGGGSSKGVGLGMIMLVLAPLLTGFTAYSIANNHTKNVRALARDIDRLGTSGDPARHLRAQGQEASTLARSVERMVGNIEFRAKHEGQDLDEIVSRERKVAEEIHGALISKNPPRLDNYEVETLFKPGFEIGGDHFEYFRIDDDHLGILLLDTNVRGVTAALVMSTAKAYVRMMAPGVLSPAEVLRRVNEALAGELPAGRHVTALYAVLNQTEGTATIASAGHLPLLVYRHNTGKVAKVNPEGLALGLDTGPVFDRALQEGDIPIGVGDRIVLYTDGALKIQNAEGEEFGEQRFYQTVLREAPKNSQAFVNFVGSTIDQFHLEVQQNDDITISTVKRLR